MDNESNITELRNHNRSSSQYSNVSSTISGEHYSPTLSTSGTRSTGSSGHSLNISSTPKSSSKKFKDIEPKVRHKYAAIWNACYDNINRALDNREDFFLRNNAIEQVKESLSELWSFRTEHNQAFAETVNMIQGVLIDRKAEDFSDNQLDTLRSIFDKLSNEPSLDDSLANIISIDLLKGNIDVFREIE